jgi:hypothetical protein
MHMLIACFILFIFGAASFAWCAYKAIQDGEIFGAWQNVLNKLYERGYKTLEKFLGGCFTCFSHLWGIVFFIGWVLFCEYFIQHSFAWWYILHYIIFVSSVIVSANIVGGIIKKLDS